jgi:hypothetical protein
MRARRRAAAAVPAALSAGLLAWAAAGCRRGEPGPPTARPPAPPARAGLAPLPLALPKPGPVPTPRNVPPGTRVRIPRNWKPRPPFLAPKNVTNVALRRPVRGTDPDPVIGEYGLITDGQKEWRLDSYVELGPGMQHVQIDLGRPCRLYAILVWHEHRDPRVYHDVVVRVADDEAFQTNVRTLFNNDDDHSAGLGFGTDWGYFETHEGLLVDARGQIARCVRLYSNGSTADDLNRYTEVEVYGLPGK